MTRRRKTAASDVGRRKMRTVMQEFYHGTLRSGSKHGPRVVKRSQAIAIGLSEARRAGARIPKGRRRGRRAAVRR